MSAAEAQASWEQLAQAEAQALTLLLESEVRKVMVIVISADADDRGTVHLLHGVSEGTTGAHLRQFILGVERKLAWLRGKLRGRG